MKICELKIQNTEDRASLVSILAFAGYKVFIEERGNYYFNKEYWVVVEDKGE